MSDISFSKELLKELVTKFIERDNYELVVKNGLLVSIKFKVKE